MKEKLFALLLAVIVGVVGYVFVSAAAKHTAIDNVKLQQFHMEFNAVHH